MPGRFAMFVTGFIIALAVIYLPDSQIVSGQSANAPTRFAAVPGEKGGQDIFGAYDVVADWPKDLSTIKGHEGWTFGAGQSVFAESPNRIFVLQRGELPNLGRPKGMRLTELGPGIVFPIGRLPWRDATTASPPGNGGTGQPAEGGMQAWEKAGQQVRRRCALGALHHDLRRPGQPDRLVEAVGLDAAAAALRRDQPVRSAEARLDRRRPQARRLQVHQRRQDEGA